MECSIRTAYLGIGSSLGDRLDNLRTAVHRLSLLQPEVQVAAVSDIYESPHLSMHDGELIKHPPHLNAVVKVTFSIGPYDLLAHIHRIEEAGGRSRSAEGRWGPRTIDIDILIIPGYEVHDERLTVPHPQLSKRRFVLDPLLGIEPDLTMPDGTRISLLQSNEAIVTQQIEWAANANELLL